MKLKQLWNQLNLKKKVLVFFLPLNILSIILILIFSISLIVKNGKEEKVENSTDKLLLVANQTDQIVSNIKYNIKAFSTSSALQTALCTKYPDNSYGNYMFSTSIHSSIYNIMDIQSFISNGYIQTYDGKIFDIKTDEIGIPTDEMNQIYEQISAQNGRILLNPPMDTSGTSAFNISKSLIDINTGTCLGVLSFDIKESLFFDAYSAISDKDGDSFFLTNDSGTIISSEDRSALQKNVPKDIWSIISKELITPSVLSVDNTRSLVISTLAAEKSIYVTYTMNYYRIYQEALMLAFLLLSIGAFLLIITVFLSQILAKSLVHPIIQLADYADEAGRGNFDAPMPIYSKDEIGFLACRFQNMSSNIRDLTTCIYNEQNKKREYELRLLQAQINPHFLYNCLDNISSLVIDHREQTAASMIHHLGRYYRAILSKGRNIITIKEELHLIQDYLEIQLIKTPGLFTYTINAEPELEDLKILKMILQPIVENSVIHGLSGYVGKGKIIIEAVSEDTLVRIKVFDNGRGIPKETLNFIFTPSSTAIPQHFGLQNVHERIQLKFGLDYGLSISSDPNHGTTVIICFPKTL